MKDFYSQGQALRACLHGGGGPRAGEVTRLGGVTRLSIYLDQVYMIGGVTRLGGLSGLLGRVTLPAGVAFCHVNVSRWGNPPTRGRFMLPKRAKSKPTTKRPPYWNRNNMFLSRG